MPDNEDLVPGRSIIAWQDLAEAETFLLQRHLDRIRRIAAIPAREERGTAGEPRACGGRRNSSRRGETRQELLGRLLDPILTLDETARMLDVCPATVRRYTNRGILSHERSQGNQRRFRLSCVLAFMEAQARSSPTSASAQELLGEDVPASRSRKA